MIDLWLRQPATFLPEALAEGFRNFTWHVGIAMAKRVDPISRVRAYSLPYGESTRIMLIDYAGAPEYSVFSSYDKPLAVYPTWAPDEPMSELVNLCKNPPGDNPRFYGNMEIAPVHRPVKGQRHRVVVHRISNKGDKTNLSNLMLWLRDLQAEHDVEIFVSGLTSFDHLFGYDLAGVDYRPISLIDNLIYPQVTLPSGKVLVNAAVYDKRYKDWFELLDFDQGALLRNQYGDRRMFPSFCMRAAQWARLNWDKVEAFVLDRQSKIPKDRDLTGRILQPSSAFVLPGRRQRTMRSLGLQIGELDRFMCDVCILHNTCTLYRAGSVCTVRGAETVSLSEAFGTRSADRIVDGLSKLLERQAQRLEDSLAAEDPTDPSPDVTRQLNSVFANGVKLAKLLDPALAGGPKVQVNVGIAAGGSAAIVAQQDPRQITATIVRELEASGIPREQITSEMLAGYLKTMGVTEEQPKRAAISAARAAAPVKVAKRLPEDYSPEEELIDKPDLLEGELLNADA